MQGADRLNQGFTLFELITVVVVIGLLMATGMSYYGKILDDTRRTGVEVLANRFTAAVALAHAKWILQGGYAGRAGSRKVNMDGVNVYLNERGWVANSDGRSIQPGGQTAEACHQIWQAVLQNPALATVQVELAGDSDRKGAERYRISEVGGQMCRYELITSPGGTHYFDYDLETGQVLISVPPLD